MHECSLNSYKCCNNARKLNLHVIRSHLPVTSTTSMLDGLFQPGQICTYMNVIKARNHSTEQHLCSTAGVLRKRQCQQNDNLAIYRHYYRAYRQYATQASRDLWKTCRVRGALPQLWIIRTKKCQSGVILPPKAQKKPRVEPGVIPDLNSNHERKPKDIIEPYRSASWIVWR